MATSTSPLKTISSCAEPSDVRAPSGPYPRKCLDRLLISGPQLQAVLTEYLDHDNAIGRTAR